MGVAGRVMAVGWALRGTGAVLVYESKSLCFLVWVQRWCRALWGGLESGGGVSGARGVWPQRVDLAMNGTLH